MAIGFGSTLGVGASDRILSPSEAVPTQVSIHLWTYRNGEGPSGFGRMIGRTNGVFDLVNNHGNAPGTYAFGNISVGPNWYWSRPSPATWAPIGISVDTSSGSNDPIVYQSGSKLVVGSGLTQAVADAAYNTSATAWCIGNRPSDNIRNWDGMLAEFAIWNVILTDSEFADLQAGAAPSSIRPEALIHYLPLLSDRLDSKGTTWTTTGTAIQSHPPGVPTSPGGTPGYGFIKVSGSWKTLSGTYIKVGGVWKEGRFSPNVSGSWKTLA